jgi:hypothetical protein
MGPEGKEKKDPETGRDAAGTGTMEQQILNEEKPLAQNPGTGSEGTPVVDQAVPSSAAPRQASGKKSRSGKKPVITRPVIEVDRKTELLGMSTKPFPEDPACIRRRTERDLKDPDAEIPYAKTEKAVRDLVCSLLERQDRMNVDIFLEINGMKEDIGILKDQVFRLKTIKTGPAAGAKK